MKKVLSFILAVAMIASLGLVAFATELDKNGILDTTSAKNVPAAIGYNATLQKVAAKEFSDAGSKLVFGKTYYFPIMMSNTVNTNGTVFEKTLGATYAKELGSLKVTAEWTEGAEYIADVGIAPVFVIYDVDHETEINRNVYCIYIKTQGSSDDLETIVGELKVTGTPGYGDSKRENAVETKIPFDATIAYEEVNLVTAPSSAKYTFAGSTIEFTSTAADDNLASVNFKGAALKTFTFNQDVTAELDGASSKTFKVTFNSWDDADVVASNPDAVLMFYNIELNFREKAEVTVKPIDAEGANYLYQKLPSGAIKNLTDTYNADDEEFFFTARKLTGEYILSDMPLVF